MPNPEPGFAYLGSEGSFSHAAGSALFPNVRATGCEDFDKVFDAVASGALEYGVLPVENSITGRVIDAYRIIANRDLYIVAEHILPIEHCLIGPEGVETKAVEQGEGLEIYSHRQALMQCSDLLAIDFPSARRIETSDTASAVKAVAEAARDDQLAIGSEFAAQLYGGQVLRRGVNNAGANYTRFIAIRRFEAPGAAGDITTILFQVRHTPNALANALAVLGAHGINMLKMETYGVSRATGSPTFCIDLGGGLDVAAVSSAVR